MTTTIAPPAADVADQVEPTPTQDCGICAYSAEHGHWGPQLRPDRSHCRDCHVSWTSLREAHCRTCCAHFANPKAFDAHMFMEGCKPPETVMRRDGTPRFTTREGRAGTVWRLAYYGTRPNHWGDDDADETPQD